MERVALVAVLILLVNLPFGYWRAGLRRFSPAWFVAVHAPVPLVVALRSVAGLGFRWSLVPLWIAAYFAGQSLGAWMARHRTGGARNRGAGGA